MSNKTDKTRVAFYIRMGGNGDVDMSYKLLQKHYTDMVDKNPDWVTVGFYADLGEDSRKQPHLGRLASDCRAGRVDMVIVKSTSRLSRNLSELMRFVRELACMNPPIGVYFEDLGFNTLEYDKFLLLSMYEAMAIKESQTKNERIPFSGITKQMRMHLNQIPKQKKEDAGNE